MNIFVQHAIVVSIAPMGLHLTFNVVETLDFHKIY